MWHLSLSPGPPAPTPTRPEWTPSPSHLGGSRRGEPDRAVAAVSLRHWAEGAEPVAAWWSQEGPGEPGAGALNLAYAPASPMSAPCTASTWATWPYSW